MFSIFNKQDNRSFFIGFTMCGANLRAYMFHRGGTMESTPMSLHTNPGIVAQALVAIAHGSLRSIGYDPTVTTLQFNAHMNPRMIQVCIQLDNLDSKPQESALTIDTCLFSSHSVQVSRVPLTNHYSFLNLPKKPKTHPSFSDSLASTTRIEPILSDEDPDRTPRARTSNLPSL
jgi:hypothetical protein